ncbi:osmoprotectant transport system substrate-binding protein [Actinomycetospora succinea]|uniref:Osmoprotectant transport system substrate-binding protein n=1 Tax=Actinomycetospora succinea TaxID=663603 RepID=A0A4R6VRF9_9PSEU|nr:ABC transporter substrate-binding protein [Actinomycetospora succinea]TDQ65050.1 osmoprotectant transport system substrate-binding protein [Actinomycetospora succinea]
MIRSQRHQPSSAPLRRPRLLLLAAVAAVGVLLAGCGGGSDPLATQPAAPSAQGTVRIGSANFTENRLVAEIYATALETKGVAVERRFGIGSRETYYPALQRGEIDLVPDYTGNLLQFLDPQATATASDEIYQQLTTKVAPNLQLLQQSAAEDKDAVVVTRAYATQNNLRSIQDLAPLCSTISFGGPPEFQQRSYGVPGLQRNYNCTFREFRALDAGGPLTVAALRDGTVQAADLFTTDAAIPENDFVVLEDPRSNFAAQNVVPLVNRAKSSDPRVTDTLNQISARMDTAQLTQLNQRLAGPDRPDPAQVARDWLAQAGIQ